MIHGFNPFRLNADATHIPSCRLWQKGAPPAAYLIYWMNESGYKKMCFALRKKKQASIDDIITKVFQTILRRNVFLNIKEQLSLIHI